VNDLERAMRKVRDAAAPHPYDTRARTAILNEAEAKALVEHLDWLRRERSEARDRLYDIERRQDASLRRMPARLGAAGWGAVPTRRQPSSRKTKSA